MKKVVIILAIVLAVIVGTYFADKATRLSGKTQTSAAAPDSGALNKPEPDLTLKDLDGKDVSLAQYKGKVVLVNFWATWCDPCRMEIPWLIDMQAKYGPKGLPGSAGPWTRKAKAWSRRLCKKRNSTSTARPRL